MAKIRRATAKTGSSDQQSGAPESSKASNRKGVASEASYSDSTENVADEDSGDDYSPPAPKRPSKARM